MLANFDFTKFLLLFQFDSRHFWRILFFRQRNVANYRIGDRQSRSRVATTNNENGNFTKFRKNFTKTDRRRGWCHLLIVAFCSEPSFDFNEMGSELGQVSWKISWKYVKISWNHVNLREIRISAQNWALIWVKCDPKWAKYRHFVK